MSKKREFCEWCSPDGKWCAVCGTSHHAAGDYYDRKRPERLRMVGWTLVMVVILCVGSLLGWLVSWLIRVQ